MDKTTLRNMARARARLLQLERGETFNIFSALIPTTEDNKDLELVARALVNELNYTDFGTPFKYIIFAKKMFPGLFYRPENLEEIGDIKRDYFYLFSPYWANVKDCDLVTRLSYYISHEGKIPQAWFYDKRACY